MRARPTLIAAAVAIATVAPAGAATAHPRAGARSPLTPPPLTGPSPVGTYALQLTDRSRTDPTMRSGHRELMIQLWYPAARAAGPLAPYMPAKVAALVEREDHLPPGTIGRIRVRAHLDAPAAAGRHPVVLFSPGSSEMRSDDSALVEDLASSGFVVVAIDHTHEAELVQLADGRIVRGSFVDTGVLSNERALRTRVADVRFILGQLPALDRTGPLAHELDLDETGMFGFSLGGATAAAAMLADPRLEAGADLDGTVYGPVRTRGLTRPFLSMVERHGSRLDPSVRMLAAHSRGPSLLLALRGAAHESFTDFVWVEPQLAQIAPAAAAQIDVGTIGPRAVREQSAYLTAFFDTYLEHRHPSLLAHPSPADPDVVVIGRRR